MKNMLINRISVLLLIFGLLSGCASSGSLQITKPSTITLSKFKSLLINVTSEVPESSKEVMVLSGLLLAKLQERGLFEDVASANFSSNAKAELVLNVNVTDIRRVGDAARFFLGALAGQAKINANAELVDLNEDKTIGKFTAEGLSSGGTRYAGYTSQAIERISEQITEFVQKSM